jgi:vesicle coat complex subunit
LYFTEPFLRPQDSSDPNPLIRALAIRTMGYIQVEKTQETIIEPLRRALRDSDPYVRKTAATGVAKIFALEPNTVFSSGLIEALKDLVNDANPTVRALSKSGPSSGCTGGMGALRHC